MNRTPNRACTLHRHTCHVSRLPASGLTTTSHPPMPVELFAAARSRTLRASSATKRYTCEAKQPHMHSAWPCVSRLPASRLTTTSQPPIPVELLVAARSRTHQASSATQRYTCEGPQTHITEHILLSAGIPTSERAGSNRRTSHEYLPVELNACATSRIR